MLWKLFFIEFKIFRTREGEDISEVCGEEVRERRQRQKKWEEGEKRRKARKKGGGSKERRERGREGGRDRAGKS